MIREGIYWGIYWGRCTFIGADRLLIRLGQISYWSAWLAKVGEGWWRPCWRLLLLNGNGRKRSTMH